MRLLLDYLTSAVINRAPSAASASILFFRVVIKEIGKEEDEVGKNEEDDREVKVSNIPWDGPWPLQHFLIIRYSRWQQASANFSLISHFSAFFSHSKDELFAALLSLSLSLSPRLLSTFQPFVADDQGNYNSYWPFLGMFLSFSTEIGHRAHNKMYRPFTLKSSIKYYVSSDENWLPPARSDSLLRVCDWLGQVLFFVPPKLQEGERDMKKGTGKKKKSSFLDSKVLLNFYFPSLLLLLIYSLKLTVLMLY